MSSGLLVVTGRGAGIRYPLSEPALVIGRATSSDIQLIDSAVSRRHARVLAAEGRVTVEDLGSDNGVIVNGARITGPTVLREGDVIGIGETTFLFSEAADLFPGATGAGVLVAGLETREVGFVDRRVTGEEEGGSPVEAVEPLLAVLAEAGGAVEGRAESAIEAALRAIVRRFGAERGVVLATAEAVGAARPRVIASTGDELVVVSRTVVKKVIEEGRALLSGDATRDVIFRGGVSIVSAEIRSLLAAPLLVQGRIVGLIHLDRRSKDAFGPADLEALIPAANLLALVVMAALGVERLRKGLRRSQRAIEAPWVVAESEAFQRVVQEIKRAARSDATVVLEGESGSGKEVLARLLHAESARRDGPFVAVNCAALPAGLEESELFGHERGAFTGAHAAKEGLFEVASGGTLFLDEVGESSEGLQVKLLRALQERAVFRVGGTRAIEVDVRVVAATSRRLDDLLAAGRLRRELYFRLAVVHLRVPPLRERREDIAPLARGFAERIARDAGLGPRRLSDEVIAFLADRRLSGNVRELRNLVERLLIAADGPEIGVADVPADLLGGADLAERAVAAGERLEDAVFRLEREMILRVMARTGGVKSAAAHALGISRVTLDAKLKQHGIAWRKG
ncbi:MAG: sigma 54-interacting transcriptional regulator [Deltaproteobacteria bacterium]|nr:sigma 54-interacting transcriptional regulator [Deltaproteobacteria bacterium]